MEENISIEFNNEDLVSVKNFSKICRICLLEMQGTPFVDLLFQDKRVTDILSSHLVIEVNLDDFLPQNICNHCNEKVLEMCSLIEKCQKADAFLRSYLKFTLKDEQIEVNDDELIKEVTVDTRNSNKNKMGTLVQDLEVKDSPVKVNCTNSSENNPDTIVNGLHSDVDIYKMQVEVISNNSDIGDEIQKKKNKNEQSSQCPTCLKYISKKGLRRHINTVHTDEKPFKCHECFNTFKIKAHLKRHMLLHTGERPYVCEICGKGFTQFVGLTKHRKTHFSNKCQTDTIARPLNYTCSYCGRKFKLLKAHDNHIKKHTNVENETAKNEDKVTKEPIDKMYECATCNKSYSRKSTLRAHQLSHGEKSFLCNVCGKSFIAKMGLEEHFTIHSGEKLHNCKFCNKSFARVVTLESHLLIHMGKKAHHCNICGKSFTQSSHLRYHMLTHTGEKPYDCSYCGKRFALKGTLTVHVRTHTGETPYVCSVCNKGFYDSSSMKKHKKGHTKVTTS